MIAKLSFIKKIVKIALVISIIIHLTVIAGHSGINLPRIFGSNMVLQHGIEIPVWGTADQGEKINEINQYEAKFKVYDKKPFT